MTPLQLQSVVGTEAVFLGRLLGLALLPGVIVMGAAIVYRGYARNQMPDGVGVLIGLGSVAIWLNTTASIRRTIGGEVGAFDLEAAIFTLVVFGVAGITSDIGRRTGDRVGVSVFAMAGTTDIDSEVGQVVRAVGRVITVDLPAATDDIEDIEGYDPVSDESKQNLADRTFLFPRRLTIPELRDRFVQRLQDDYGIGYVDVEFSTDGSIEYIAVGSRAAGIGPTLTPGTSAIAIRADPAFTASSGDTVQVWQRIDGEPKRIVSGELKSVAEDTATIAVYQSDADLLKDEGQYRLVTLPGGLKVEKEFISLLRAADETMARVTINEGSPLTGVSVGGVDVTVAAIRHTDGRVTTIPDRATLMEPGATAYVIARAEDIRRFELAAGSPRIDATPS